LRFTKKITNDNWVLQIVKEGYMLEFIEKIPHTGIRKTNVSERVKNSLLPSHDTSGKWHNQWTKISIYFVVLPV
jgi:hypothetical protein